MRRSPTTLPGTMSIEHRAGRPAVAKTARRRNHPEVVRKERRSSISNLITTISPRSRSDQKISNSFTTATSRRLGGWGRESYNGLLSVDGSAACDDLRSLESSPATVRSCQKRPIGASKRMIDEAPRPVWDHVPNPSHLPTVSFRAPRRRKTASVPTECRRAPLDECRYCLLMICGCMGERLHRGG